MMPRAFLALTLLISSTVLAQTTIDPARPIPAGLAPAMQVKLVKDTSDEQIYAVVFLKGDELLSGLTDFAIKYKITDAHLTGIGAVSSATLGWLSLPEKRYHAIPVAEQAEVLSLIGDIAAYNGKPVVHAHLVLGKQDGSTIGGHLWEAHVQPTVEIFVTVNRIPLAKRADETSGIKLIDPTR